MQINKKLSKAQLMELLAEQLHWRDAICEAMQSAGLGPLQPGTSPVLAMDWIIAQHLNAAERERVVPLSPWQISTLDLQSDRPEATVRKVERALGVVEPGEELLRVSVPVQVPDAVRPILEGCLNLCTEEPHKDRSQALWNQLLQAASALEPPVKIGADLQAWIGIRPTVSRDPTKPKIQITKELLVCDPSAPVAK